MLARAIVFTATLAGLALAGASEAEAKRLRFSFGGSKAHAATPKPAAPSPAVRANPAATPSRSGSFVFVSTGRGSSSGTAPTDEQRRPQASEPAPMLATMTYAPGYAPKAAAEKPVRPATGFETVQAQVPGFQVVKPLN
ncbi:MAG TPA: hypothetical protein VIL65_16600 [Beijerinckiaceae bacterium]|jgi:hypothetical protein